MTEYLAPIMWVADANAAVTWYERLGFVKEWEHRYADEATVTRRQAGLAPRPLTRTTRGAIRRTEGVVQRTGHPHDHDDADAHGDAKRCEHVGRLRIGRQQGTSSRRRHRTHHSSSMSEVPR